MLTATLRRTLPALLALLVLFAAPPAAAQVVFGPGLSETLDGMGPFETTTVVVTFDTDGPLTAEQTAALTGLGVTSGMTFQSLPIAGVQATAAQVAAIAGLDGVVSVWPNHELAYSNAESTALTGVDDARTDGDFRRENGGLPVSGRGVGVVVNDSGVDGLHKDVEYGRNLVQNVLGTTNLNAYLGLLPITYVEDQPSTDTNSGHGTHVAATVGGTGAQSGGLHEGVAPGADLVGYGSGGVLLVLDGIGGIDYALTQQFRYGIRVVTNSWGSSGRFDPAHPIVQATYRAYQRGISVLFAAGNEGPGADTHNPYAQAPWVISVAAGNKDGATLADFSSRGVDGESATFTMPDGTEWTYRNEPTITAPGVDVISACAAGSPICALGIQPDNPFYTQISGTSMATPHVAGIVALMLEADPSLQPLDVIRVLRETATPLDYEAWEAGAGYVNAYAAVAEAFGFDPAGYLKDAPGTGGEGGEPLPAGVVLADAEGDASMAGADITGATIFEEEPGRFQVTLNVADLDQALPSTLLAAGLQVGAMQDYAVEFDLVKDGAPTVRYTLSAKRTLASVGVGSVALDEPSFDYGVRAADGSGRGIGDLPGLWDEEAGTITWIVTTDLLTVATPPADLTGDIDQTGRAARAGDRLGAFSADVGTSVWGGVVGLTPGQTTYDTASGTAVYTLGDNAEAPDMDPDDDEGGVDDKNAFKNVRPVLECVADNGDGTFTARFGTLNDNATTTTLPIGSKNQFAPSPRDRNQPTVFAPGRQVATFEVDYESRFLVWKLGRRTATAGTRSPACPTAAPQVVVSVIDSGINPYHAFFNAGGEVYTDAAPSAVTPEIREAFGIDEAHTLRLTRTGDFNADFAADAAQWASVRPGEVYWFEGTNVLAVSYDPGTRILLPDDEEDTHGVGTSAAVLRANPEAVVLFVEGITDESEAFAFNHPAVDIVSTSYGAIGSLPLPSHINNSYVGVVENGKVHVGAADNSPSTAVQDGTAGPWWSIGVAGFEEGTSEGKQLLSGSLPDFVGDFTQTLPYCAECEDGQRSVGGTSFATPRTAGTLSRIILEARRDADHLGGVRDVDGEPVLVARDGDPVTTWTLRRATEEAAYVPTISEYDPVESAFDTIGLPVPPAAPYALVGWGAVTPDPEHGVIEEALAHLGVGGSPTRSKDAQTCTFMTSLVTARHVYWDNLALESESFTVRGEDPYEYCTSGAAPAPLGVLGASLQAAGHEFGLDQNAPNPFRASTRIAFSLAEAGPARLAVYDVLGRQVAVLVDGPTEAGTHEAQLQASSLASGTYLLRLEAGGEVATRQMTLAR